MDGTLRSISSSWTKLSYSDRHFCEFQTLTTEMPKDAKRCQKKGSNVDRGAVLRPKAAVDSSRESEIPIFGRVNLSLDSGHYPKLHETSGQNDQGNGMSGIQPSATGKMYTDHGEHQATG